MDTVVNVTQLNSIRQERISLTETHPKPLKYLLKLELLVRNIQGIPKKVTIDSPNPEFLN